jgi:hypothetical protein
MCERSDANLNANVDIGSSLGCSIWQWLSALIHLVDWVLLMNAGCSPSLPSQNSELGLNVDSCRSLEASFE